MFPDFKRMGWHLWGFPVKGHSGAHVSNGRYFRSHFFCALLAVQRVLSTGDVPKRVEAFFINFTRFPQPIFFQPRFRQLHQPLPSNTTVPIHSTPCPLHSTLQWCQRTSAALAPVSDSIRATIAWLTPGPGVSCPLAGGQWGGSSAETGSSARPAASILVSHSCLCSGHRLRRPVCIHGCTAY